jgi:hypothetical protein
MNNVFSVEQLFAGRLFRVPDYQRGYSWETQQRTEFLEDLEMLGPGREHYTGTIILHEIAVEGLLLDAEGKSHGRMNIVDGQQRLTTIVLLLDAIRRELASMTNEPFPTLAAGIKRGYVAATAISGQPLYKLSLNDDCDHYFKTVAVSDQPGPEGPQISSERRLADARAEFASYLHSAKAAQGNSYAEWLTEIYTKVTNQLKVSLYEVKSAAEVGVIFEVMNNRGKPLSDLEKVKNYLLYAGSTLSIPHELDKAVNGAWGEIFRQLMAAGLTTSDDEDQLLRAHWLTEYDPQSRNWTGSKAVKAHFDLRKYQGRQEHLLDELTRYTEGLRASCVGYCDARSPERQDSFASMKGNALRDEVKDSSAKLVRINVVATFLPLLIATRNRFADDAPKYLELTKLCEAFAFRVYRLLERRSNAGQADLFRIGHQLRKRAITFDEALMQVRQTLLWFCPDVKFEEALRREDYDWYNWAGLKYFLYEYEEHLAGKKGALPKIPWEDVRKRERADTIEHVLPQTPAHPYWRQRFDDAARKNLTHDIGNLALTKDNASYGNKPFPLKKGAAGLGKPCYAESPFFMERDLATLDDWDPTHLTARRTALVDWALWRWHVQPVQTAGAPAVPPELDDSEGDVLASVDGEEEPSG